MKTKRKILISVLVVLFVVLSVVATMAIVFALSKQTFATSLNMSYTAKDIYGSVKGSYTVGGSDETDLIASTGGTELKFRGEEIENGALEFPEESVDFVAGSTSMVVKYTFSNSGRRHYIASMSFDSELISNNMNIEFGIWDETTSSIKYSEQRYAVVVQEGKERSYWIKISVDDSSRDANFIGDFIWDLQDCDDNENSYESLASMEFVGDAGTGTYSASVSTAGDFIGSIVFPDNVNGNTVKTIAASPLSDAEKAKVTDVTIPSTVETVGDNAFESFTSLEEVTFEQNQTAGSASVLSQSSTGLTSIGWYAFSGCASLKEINLPDSLTSLAMYAFSYSGLTYFETPKFLTYIDFETFSYCKNLREIKITDNVTGISSWAFGYCENLAIITLGSGLNYLDSSAFYNCTNISSINISSNNTTYRSIDNCLIEIASKKLYLGCKTSIIPADDSITSIGVSAFSGAAGLKKVVIPDCVTSIDYGAFENCTGLKSLIIGKGLNHIDNYAFINCSSLETIEVDEGNSTYYSEGNCLIETFNQKLFLGTSLSEIPNTVTSIGEKAFYGNTSLVSINIPESITSIGGSAFWGCTNLSKVNITNIVKWCGIVFEYADSNPLRTGAELYLNNQLITKLVIPNDVTRIENYAFYNNSNLTSVTFGSGIVYIGEDAFYGCTGLTELVIPDNITSVGKNAFNDCEGLTKITLGTGLTSLPYRMFYGCKSLKEITIPNNIKTINGGVFSNCDALVTVVMSNSVTSIGEQAFSFCDNLTEITIPSSVTELGRGVCQYSGLSSATFENTEGWSRKTWSSSSWTAVSSSTLANKSTAATYLTQDYSWKRA